MMFAIVFESRSDNGPKFVGPFPAREGAKGHLADLARPKFTCSSEIVELVRPIHSIRAEVR